MTFLLGPVSSIDPSGTLTTACLLALDQSCKAIKRFPKAQLAKCMVEQVTATDICGEEVLPFDLHFG